jgi:hypothetical protein
VYEHTKQTRQDQSSDTERQKTAVISQGDTIQAVEETSLVSDICQNVGVQSYGYGDKEIDALLGLSLTVMKRSVAKSDLFLVALFVLTGEELSRNHHAADKT